MKTKEKIEGYKLIKGKIQIVGKKQKRTNSLSLENTSIIEFDNNFKEIFKNCKNKKTPSILFKKYLLKTYKKQEWILEELMILDADENIILECIFQLALSGKVKNHLIIGCCRGYMVEMYPIRCEGEKKFRVFCRKFAEWQYSLRKKTHVLSLCKAI